MNAIEIKGLCKRYNRFSLKGIDLTLPCGCIMGLIGENGAATWSLTVDVTDGKVTDVLAF